MMQALLKQRISKAIRILEKHQGIKSWPGPTDPLDVLMLTFLSQNTNDTLRDRAFDNLRQRFPTWEKVLKAPVAEIQGAIRLAGLSGQKSQRMQDFLRWVKDRFGRLSLQALEGMADDDAIELLTSQKGVGIKTATVVLMAAFGRDLCPVDTHVHRIAGRLEWIPPNVTAENTFLRLRPHIPKGRGHSLHMNLLQFGRTICLARKPLCGVCFLYEECQWEGKTLRKANLRNRAQKE